MSMDGEILVEDSVRAKTLVSLVSRVKTQLTCLVVLSISPTVIQSFLSPVLWPRT